MKRVCRVAIFAVLLVVQPTVRINVTIPGLLPDQFIFQTADTRLQWTSTPPIMR